MTSIIEKLQKLIAHEKSVRSLGNQAEAEAFAAKIQALLFANNLSMSEVEIEDQERNEPIGEEYVRGAAMGRRSKRIEWMEDLAGAVASGCFCKNLIVSGSNTQIFVGRTSDRMAASELFRYLANSALAICKTEFSVLNPCPQIPQSDRFVAAYRAAESRNWKRSFLLGFASAIDQRLRVERKELEVSTEGTLGLVLMRRKASDVERYLDQALRKVPSARSIGSDDVNHGAFGSGYRRGKDFSLSARNALAQGGAR